MPKILFLNIYYESFLDKHYRDNPELSSASYEEQETSIQATMFGDSDFYSHAMNKLGWNAKDLIINAGHLQKRWARDFSFNGSSLEEIMIEQIKMLKPDVVYSQGVWVINQEVHDAIRPHVKLITGQVGFPLDNYAAPFYDVLFTTLPENVKKFEDAGTPAHYVPLAFDPRALDFEIEERMFPITFVGNLTGNHTRRRELLEVLSDHRRIDCWGSSGYEQLQHKDNIHYHGEAWGNDMFAIMRQSAMTLNCHIDSIEPYVGNMRMFEATGCGALVFTDYGTNAKHFFANREEAIYYQSPKQCLDLIQEYILNPYECLKVAKAGQAHTLANHTYDRRMKFVSVVLKGML